MHPLAVLSDLRPRFAYTLNLYGHARSHRRASTRRGEVPLYSILCIVQESSQNAFTSNVLGAVAYRTVEICHSLWSAYPSRRRPSFYRGYCVSPSPALLPRQRPVSRRVHRNWSCVVRSPTQPEAVIRLHRTD